MLTIGESELICLVGYTKDNRKFKNQSFKSQNFKILNIFTNSHI